jgi:hypothetical protein
MTDEEWDEMTLEKKCDHLRSNQDRLYAIASDVATEIRRLENQLVPKLNGVATAVEKLEAQMRARGDK